MTVSTLIETLVWREPLWLLLVLQPLLLIILRRVLCNRNMTAYADQHLHPWVTWHSEATGQRQHKVREWIYGVSWVLLAVSLAGPRLAIDRPDVQRQTHGNIMVVVDASRSMHTTDVPPGRLQRARVEMHTLLRMAAYSRIGIIMYAARPHLLVPLTRDHDAIDFYIRQLDDISMPTRGSKPSAALALAGELLDADQDDSPRAIVWLTDGDFSSKDQDLLEQTTRQLAKRDIPLFILGLGSAEGGAVPTADGWLEVDGRPVISRMDSTRLARLAELGGGVYALVRDDDADWISLYHEGISRAMTRPAVTDDTGVTWLELYPWTLLPALLLLFVSLLPYRLPMRRIAALILPCLVISMSGLAPFPVQAGSGLMSDLAPAYRDLQQKRYAEALEQFARTPGYAGRLGEGISFYRIGDFTQAAHRFSQAVLLAPTDSQRGMAIFNLANSYFKQGDYALAAQMYVDALRYPGDHESARHNHALSAELARAVTAERTARKAGRMGSGPQAGRAQQGLDINPSGSISFDSETDDRQRAQQLPALPESERNSLIHQGIEYARLRGDRSAYTSQAIGQALETSRIELRMRELADNQADLWQRLFEMEEGFPAPLDESRDIPGIRPW